jgi:hypothetical protein
MYIPGDIILKSTSLMEGVANMCKSLDAKHCSMNNHVYLKRHYPEVYILDGGYCKYVQEFGSHCDPLMRCVTVAPWTILLIPFHGTKILTSSKMLEHLGELSPMCMVSELLSKV